MCTEFFTRAAWLYVLEDVDKLIDRNSTLVWASCGSVPLQPFHMQLSQPFSNHQVREGQGEGSTLVWAWCSLSPPGEDSGVDVHTVAREHIWLQASWFTPDRSRLHSTLDKSELCFTLYGSHLTAGDILGHIRGACCRALSQQQHCRGDAYTLLLQVRTE